MAVIGHSYKSSRLAMLGNSRLSGAHCFYVGSGPAAIYGFPSQGDISLDLLLTLAFWVQVGKKCFPARFCIPE